MSSPTASSYLYLLRQRSASPTILLAWLCLSSATLPIECDAGLRLWRSGPRRTSFVLTFSASLYLTTVATNVSIGVSRGVTNVLQLTRLRFHAEALASL